MKLELIDRVRENDILGKSILTNDGGILLRAGIRLTTRYISKLKQLGVLYIYIEDERLDDVMVEDDNLLKFKRLAMKSMLKTINNLHTVGNGNVKDAIRTVEDIVEYIIECGDVNKSLYDIQTYDNYTYMHCIDTCIMTTFLGMTMNYNEKELKELAIAGVLHDVGKIKIPSKIINKKGRLTEEECSEIKKHPIYGKEILEKNMSIPNTVIKAVEQHHERVDGKGYPYGLNGNEIFKYGKVICICDVYDAVSNDRSYRKKFKPNDAYELVLAGSGNIFDENMVMSFKNTFAIYPLGCCVKLSNNTEGYVIRQNRGFPDRPIVRVMHDYESEKKACNFYEMDLLKRFDIVIEGVV